MWCGAHSQVRVNMQSSTQSNRAAWIREKQNNTLDSFVNSLFRDTDEVAAPPEQNAEAVPSCTFDGLNPVKGKQSINQSMNVFNVLGGNWDPTDKKFSSVNSYRQDLFPTCKALPKETTTCIWFTQSHEVCNGTTVLQEVEML